MHGVQRGIWPFISSKCCISTTYDMLLSTIGCVDVDMIKLSDHHTSRHPTWLCKKTEHTSSQQSAYYIMWCMKCLISSCICIYELICAHSNHMYIYIYCLACTAAHQLPTHSAFWPKTSCTPSLHSTMATVLEQVTRRIDTARDVMSRITTQQHAKVSSLQKSAVSELLVAAITQGVSAEDVAMLTDKCVAANFLPADLDELLSVLAQKAAEKRRKQQTFLFQTKVNSVRQWHTRTMPTPQHQRIFLLTKVTSIQQCRTHTMPTPQHQRIFLLTTVT